MLSSIVRNGILSDPIFFSMFDFKSAEISEDGETLMHIMSPPGQISIECDQSDTDHVCLGPWLYNTVHGPWTTNCFRLYQAS